MQREPRVALRRGLSLPRRAVRRLAEVGIFVRPDVSLEHQHLARRYVIRGVESGGAIAEIGRYVSFAAEEGEPLTYLHPIDAVGVNGLHAVVVAPVLVRVEMFRVGRTCELLITKHWPGEAKDGRRPPLESKVLFRGVNGFLEVELRKKGKEAKPDLPIFYSRAGELVEIPATFHAAVEAVASGIRCEDCSHCHYLMPPLVASPATIGTEIGPSGQVGNAG
ncbi:MAG: hypothetical protein ACYDA9_18510 [Terriglobia bacterium]